jgi:hypothetical protein
MKKSTAQALVKTSLLGVALAMSLWGSGTTTLSAATTAVAYAYSNATVQPSGPRTGANGLNYFNVEGPDKGGGNFNSFGVVDFSAPQLGLDSSQNYLFNQITLNFTEANSSFSAAGPINFYLASDTSTSILNDGSSPLRNDGTMEGVSSGGQLGTLYFLGQGNFSPISNGTVDTYTFNLTDPAIQTLLNDLIDSNGTLRIVATAAASYSSATWSGYTFNAETLMLDYQLLDIPEPSTYALLASGIAGLIFFAWHRRKPVIL